MHGFVKSDLLIKTGKQVVKYFKLNGYAVAVKDLEKVRGVELHTKYDGVLYAPRNLFYQHGIANDFNSEAQLVLPVQYWERLIEKDSL